MELNAILKQAVDLGASDIHLKAGRPPVLRRDGALGDMEKTEALTPWDMEDILTTISRPDQIDAFHATGDLDLAYQVAGLPRFRVNAFRQREQIGFAFRVISAIIPSFDELGMPPGVERLANEPRGLILVTGATGSGKTTTLAAVVDHINRTRRDHVLTIEDPIEIVHQEQRGVISQREVGLDTGSFGEGLRRALRQDPDVILIGELRDSETAQVALQAAESGHLVLSTLHTVDAAESCGRIIEFFPPEKQEVIRSILAGVLRGVVSQRLLPRVDGGRVPAVEVMVTNTRIADLIREGRPDEITDAVAEGEFFNMQTFAQALIKLVISGVVDRETAANASTNRHDFLVMLERAEKQARVDGAAVQPAEQADEPADDEPAEDATTHVGLRVKA
ncbi:MAG TPA: PilT/PilU family type 4a pilus ATPase [Gaiellaceae bacterium]|nr:PilT/PilU family type 4a pilus ATPase [Gaiellaceae bacterium]HVC87684.1 PilT/PilU family type 4a pilus ATPase [Gaiellaceae bacterium]